MPAHLPIVLILALFLLVTGCATDAKITATARTTPAPAAKNSPTPAKDNIAFSTPAPPAFRTRGPGTQFRTPGYEEGGTPISTTDETPTLAAPIEEIVPAPQAPANWLDFSDATYHFSIKYPDSYVILAEPDPSPAMQPALVHQVRFQTKELATAETADLEPPQFTIQVFARSGAVPLRDWLIENRLLPSGADMRPARLTGASEAVSVRLRVLMSPNQFYYAANAQYVYRLIPLDSAAEEMLASFRLN